jgi:hypothetical protein
MNITAPRSLLCLALTSLALSAAGCSAGPSADGDELASADEEVGVTEDALTGNRAVGSPLVTTTGLNLRGGPGTTHAILLTMPAGARVTVLAAAPSNGFYNVKYGTRAGWASGTYLTTTAAPPAGGGAARVAIQGPAVRPHVQSFANAACAKYGCPYELGTRVGHDPSADRAVDMMMGAYGTVPPAAGVTRGTNIANFGVSAAANAYKVYYVIWRQRINTLDGRGWRVMADRGSLTQNHFDHVHVSFDL